jgi:hypothetical protein
MPRIMHAPRLRDPVARTYSTPYYLLGLQEASGEDCMNGGSQTRFADTCTYTAGGSRATLHHRVTELAQAMSYSSLAISEDQVSRALCELGVPMSSVSAIPERCFRAPCICDE